MADVEERVLYADTSALVKLVVREAESEALERELTDWPSVATSAITAIELARAVARARTIPEATVAEEWTQLGVIAAMAEIPLTEDVRTAAATLTPVELRTLDAIHLASALSLGDELGAIVTYDHRMRDASIRRGLTILDPA